MLTGSVLLSSARFLLRAWHRLIVKLFFLSIAKYAPSSFFREHVLQSADFTVRAGAIA